MSEIDYSEIKAWLEHGQIKQLAKAHEIEPNAAWKIISGRIKRPNIKFLNAVMDAALSNKRTLMEKQRALKNMNA
jgi:ABC-type sugar transport system ATPase subunit